jgi:hypothetical protein
MDGVLEGSWRKASDGQYKVWPIPDLSDTQ